MSAYGTKVVAVLDTKSTFSVTLQTLKTNVDVLTSQMSTLLADTPETLDTLNEIAAAISDDPAFFTTMATANTTLQTNITALAAAAATARTALQTALQANIDSTALTSTNARGVLSGRLDALELDPVTKTYVDAAVANLIDTAPGVLDTLNELAAAIGDDANFITTVNTSIAAVQTDVDANETAANTAIAAVQADVDANEVTAAGLVTAQNTAMLSAVAVVQADVDQNETDTDAAINTEKARIDAILAGSAADKDTFAEIVSLVNSVDTTNDNAFAGYVTSNNAAVAALQLDVNNNESDADTAIAAVQTDVDANEAASDAAEAALSTRLDTLEADPTTATAVAAVQTDVDANQVTAANAVTAQNTAMLAAVAVVQADVDTNESDADTAIALKANKAGDTFTGDVVLRKSDGSAVSLVLSRADHADMSCEWKISPSYVSSSKECLTILAAGQPVAFFDERQRVSINKTDPDYTLDVGGDGKFSTGLTVGGLTDAANDSAAATAGVAVNQLYRNGSIVMIRVS